MTVWWDVVGGPGEAGREMSRACPWCRCVWSREGLDALPGGRRARKQTLLLDAGTMAPLFPVVGRRSSVRRMPRGGRAARWQAGPPRRPAPHRAAASAERREKKINQLFRSKFTKKMCKKRRHWHCLENQGDVSLDLNSRRRQKVFILHSYIEGGLAGGR